MSASGIGKSRGSAPTLAALRRLIFLLVMFLTRPKAPGGGMANGIPMGIPWKYETEDF